MPITSPSPSILASEQILFTPAQPEPNAVPILFAFPNTYTVGITSLGYQVIWSMLASRSDKGRIEYIPSHPPDYDLSHSNFILCSLLPISQI